MTLALILTSAFVWVQTWNCTDGGMEIGIVASIGPPVFAVGTSPAFIIPSGFCVELVESTNILWKTGRLAGRCVYTNGRPDSKWEILPVGEVIIGVREEKCVNL